MISLFAAELIIQLWTGLLWLQKAGRLVLFLFEGPSSNSAYTAQNDKLAVSMKWKGRETRRPWPDLRCYRGIGLKAL